MEPVNTELRATNPNSSHRKRKWTEQGTPSESVNQNVKKSTPAPPISYTTGLVGPYGKYGQTNHITLECRVGTNKCLRCGSTEHFIAA